MGASVVEHQGIKSSELPSSLGNYSWAQVAGQAWSFPWLLGFCRDNVGSPILTPVGGPGTGGSFRFANTSSIGTAAARYAPHWPPVLGAILLWVVSGLRSAWTALLHGWVGMVGLILLVHFGTCQIVALLWQRLASKPNPSCRRCSNPPPSESSGGRGGTSVSVSLPMS
jgi:hypothetical protein